ncbi:hypothetical protein PIB30_080931 [Stylosanthes scabra]|uniref:Uncharacterized protein n=1 Tax=Stylosanthes scabra TaxID=79078 RepID=A0ABU6RRF0_9FABA|nr:hypothetical protein [Stylosanthes scabra]
MERMSGHGVNSIDTNDTNDTLHGDNQGEWIEVKEKNKEKKVLLANAKQPNKPNRVMGHEAANKPKVKIGVFSGTLFLRQPLLKAPELMQTRVMATVCTESRRFIVDTREHVRPLSLENSPTGSDGAIMEEQVSVPQPEILGVASSSKTEPPTARVEA